MKTKENKQLRDATYYIAVASELLQRGGIVMQDDFRKILAETDQKFGIKTNFKCQKNQEDRFIELFKSVLNVEVVTRSKEERGRGKNSEVRMIELKETNQEKLKEILFVKKANKTGAAFTIMPAEKIRRDTYVEQAKEIRKENPGMTHEGSIEVAKKRVKKVSKELILKTFKILQKAKYSGDWSVSASALRKIINTQTFSKNYIKNWAKLFQAYSIGIFITVTEDERDRRTWKIVLNNNPSDLMAKVQELAKKMYDLTLVDDRQPNGPAIEKKLVRIGNGDKRNELKTTLTDRTRYLIFVMAGMLMKNGGKFLTALEVGSVLRSNRYHKIDTTSEEIVNIVKTFPEFFSQGFQDKTSFNFARKADEVWKEVQKFNPKNEKWPIPWIINSGLGLDEIKTYFPESYQVREDIHEGSTVIVVVADRSIEAFIKLSKLQLRMRECDFPIADEDFVRKLASEITVTDGLLRGLMLDRNKQDWTDKVTDNGRLLFQIEENYL